MLLELFDQVNDAPFSDCLEDGKRSLDPIEPTIDRVGAKWK